MKQEIFNIKLSNLVELILLIFVCVWSICAQNNSRKVSNLPQQAKFSTSDIDNFWRAFDLAQKATSREKKIEIFEREYFQKGSDGLKSFIERRIQNAGNLVDTIDAMPAYYASIRRSSLRVSAMRPQMLQSFKNLKKIYPQAVFPDVYFLIGRANSGGTFSDAGLLIGTEMYGLTASTPPNELNDWLRAVLKPVEEIPGIVAHELIHYQQHYASNKTLLEQSLKEGSADFVGQMISKRNINQNAYRYGAAHEKELWREFEKEMNTENTDRWLFNGSNSKDRPADLGYFIGFKICEAYYRQAKNKAEALRDILNITDAQKFLIKSSYGAKL